jgi:hypothetical protein
MFVPHVVVPHRRRDRKRATRQQRIGAVLSASMAGLVSAGIGVSFSKGSTADRTFILVAIVGLAAVIGFVVARVIGRSGKV